MRLCSVDTRIVFLVRSDEGDMAMRLGVRGYVYDIGSCERKVLSVECAVSIVSSVVVSCKARPCPNLLIVS